ncbi:hypothetical protein [Geobacter sp.]|uniref:hypothetical protein n=1 Tax=Geobacter sp. TaxID=46610 RepID=UPI0026236995|nr:hypothetical protein [Geobacter sp.]
MATIEFVRGEGVSRTFRLWRDRAMTQPFDLTGYTGKSELRVVPGESGAPAAQFAVECGADGVANAVRLSLPSAQSALLAAKSYAFDLFIAPAGGEPTCILRGTVRGAERVTIWP